MNVVYIKIKSTYWYSHIISYTGWFNMKLFGKMLWNTYLYLWHLFSTKCCIRVKLTLNLRTFGLSLLLKKVVFTNYSGGRDFLQTDLWWTCRCQNLWVCTGCCQTPHCRCLRLWPSLSVSQASGLLGWCSCTLGSRTLVSCH